MSIDYYTFLLGILAFKYCLIAKLGFYFCFYTLVR